MNGQDLGGAERAFTQSAERTAAVIDRMGERSVALAEEVRRLQSQLHDVAVECKKALNAVRYGGRDKEKEIDGHLCRALRFIEGGAT